MLNCLRKSIKQVSTKKELACFIDFFGVMLVIWGTIVRKQTFCFYQFFTLLKKVYSVPFFQLKIDN
jgi:hypothetical protein